MNHRSLFALSLAAVALLSVAGPALAQYSVPNYIEPGGRRTVIGGEIDVVSGGKLKIAGTDVTAAAANAVAGVAAGYKVARGETALDGSNPTPVTTGLTAIVACTASIKSTTALGVATSHVTYGTSAGTLNLYGWKVTSSGDGTLIASTGTDTIGWICVGS